MRDRVVVIGTGNVASAINSLHRLGWPTVIARTGEDIQNASRVIYPGVGSFGAAIERLEGAGFWDPLQTYLSQGRPFLGICIGFQILAVGSDEAPSSHGLCVLPSEARFERFGKQVSPVPHMGWNIEVDDSGVQMEKNENVQVLKKSSHVYFVHSYRLDARHRHQLSLAGWTIRTTIYGGEEFVSSARRGAIWGVQWHPERSGNFGLSFLDNFCRGSATELAMHLPLQPHLDSAEPATVEAAARGAAAAKSTLAHRVVACLDVCLRVDNSVVLTKGNKYCILEPDGRIRDLGTPSDAAEKYFRDGADEIVFLCIQSFDVEDPSTDWAMLAEIRRAASKVFVPICVGGGIRNGPKVSGLEIASAYFAAGADKVSIGSAAVLAAEEYYSAAGGKLTGKSEIESISRVFGSQAVVVSADIKRVSVKDAAEAEKLRRKGISLVPNELPSEQQKKELIWYQTTIRGGQEPRELDVVQLVKAVEALGAGELLINCIDMDGQKRGFDLKLVRLVKANTSLPVIASSGAGSVNHFIEAFTVGGADATLAAGAFHSGHLTIQEVKSSLQRAGLNIRNCSSNKLLETDLSGMGESRRLRDKLRTANLQLP